MVADSATDTVPNKGKFGQTTVITSKGAECQYQGASPRLDMASSPVS